MIGKVFQFAELQKKAKVFPDEISFYIIDPVWTESGIHSNVVCKELMVALLIFYRASTVAIWS